MGLYIYLALPASFKGTYISLQMLVADQQTTRATTADPPPSESFNMAEIKEVMKSKLVELRHLFIEAEKLRLQTLQELYSVLSSIQAAQYSVAALEMAKAIYKLGEIFQESHAGDANARSSGHPGVNIWEIASQGDVKKLREALDMCPDPSSTDYEGRTPLVRQCGIRYLFLFILSEFFTWIQFIRFDFHITYLPGQVVRCWKVTSMWVAAVFISLPNSLELYKLWICFDFWSWGFSVVSSTLLQGKATQSV